MLNLLCREFAYELTTMKIAKDGIPGMDAGLNTARLRNNVAKVIFAGMQNRPHGSGP